ncbi:MAG: hypothetical protein QXJ74_07550 [Nitrososphaera sp.]|uniref:hypothetical protein n=1 Tax=Nitrososphaera sp. TaxID=1971748 RepID=UPI00179A9C8E|nr:hypothetical protein [Nitrososphaera sp.]NWG36350.1 hypothetical protein [Nitrososphaera sp.]
MASAKGIAIMAAIVVGVVGASMFIWFGPQGQPNDASFGEDVTANNINSFLPEYALGLIYTKHHNLDAEVQLDYDKWKGGDLDSSRMLRTIDDAKADVAQMRGAFDAATPPEEWKESFDHYAAALASYSSYLGEMEELVRDGDKNADETALEQYHQESDDHVELATSAFPVDPLNTS